jgi:hypothetical protein
MLNTTAQGLKSAVLTSFIKLSLSANFCRHDEAVSANAAPARKGLGVLHGKRDYSLSLTHERTAGHGLVKPVLSLVFRQLPKLIVKSRRS